MRAKARGKSQREGAGQAGALQRQGLTGRRPPAPRPAESRQASSRAKACRPKAGALPRQGLSPGQAPSRAKACKIHPSLYPRTPLIMRVEAGKGGMSPGCNACATALNPQGIESRTVWLLGYAASGNQ